MSWALHSSVFGAFSGASQIQNRSQTVVSWRHRLGANLFSWRDTCVSWSSGCVYCFARPACQLRGKRQLIGVIGLPLLRSWKELFVSRSCVLNKEAINYKQSIYKCSVHTNFHTYTQKNTRARRPQVEKKNVYKFPYLQPRLTSYNLVISQRNINIYTEIRVLAVVLSPQGTDSHTSMQSKEKYKISCH